MGMYTGLRFKAKIKEEYADAIKTLYVEGLDWDEMSAWFKDLEVFQSMFSVNRASFIPYGVIMLDEWEEKSEHISKGWITPLEWIHNFEDNVWTFQCSLKNYDSTIEYFLEQIASKIVDEVIHIETLYEEDRYGTFYKLEGEQLIVDESKTVDYRPWED